MVNGGKRTPGGLRGRSPDPSKVPLAGVRSPPLRGGFRARMAFRRKPWHNAKGDFLGGTHSVRPRCEAVREPRHSKIIGGKRTPGGLMARSPGGSKAFLAGVRSPPVRGVASLGERPRGKTRGQCGWWFSRRGALCAPAWQGHTDADEFHLHPTTRREASGLPGTCVGQAGALVAGVQSPPLQGWAIQARTALRGKPGDGAEGGFLGGARSPRPQCQAVPKPRHDMVNGGKRTPGGLRGRSPDPSKVPLAGVRSPPLQGWAIQARTALRGKPEMTRKAVFSEGRTLCVRVARPCLCRGMSLVEMVGRKVRGLTGMCLVQAQACFDGRAEPAPPGVGYPS
jgi:hypothetical protein